MDHNVVQIETRIRVGKRAPSTQDSANEAKERGRLRVKKKLRLCDLKNKNFTLTQNGPSFTVINQSVLRQARAELRPSR